MGRKEDLIEEVRKSRGFVEDFHIVLADMDPELMEKWTGMWKHVLAESSLDLKTSALIRLALVASIRNRTAIGHSMDQAVDAGASRKEILDAMKIAFVFSGVPTLVEALSVFRQKFGIEP